MWLHNADTVVCNRAIVSCVIFLSCKDFVTGKSYSLMFICFLELPENREAWMSDVTDSSVDTECLHNSHVSFVFVLSVTNHVSVVYIVTHNTQVFVAYCLIAHSTHLTLANRVL